MHNLKGILGLVSSEKLIRYNKSDTRKRLGEHGVQVAINLINVELQKDPNLFGAELDIPRESRIIGLYRNAIKASNDFSARTAGFSAAMAKFTANLS